MKLPLKLSLLLGASCTFFALLSPAFAADAGTKDGAVKTATDAGAPRDAGRSDSGPPASNRDPAALDELPPGHPGMQPGGGDGDDGNPHGGGGDPHAHGAGGAVDPNAVPPDVSEADPKLPNGSIAVTLVDAAGKPLPGLQVTLGIIENTIAKGESRKHVMAQSGADGVAHFDGLTANSSFAYRVSVQQDGATFALMPFRLPDHGGQRGVLHVLPVTSSLETALVVVQTGLYFELKDDRVQFEQAFAFYNFGKTAWSPKDLEITLPEGFTAFTTQQAMSDVGVDPTPKGYRIRGTFTPGRHDVQFRFQLPYDADPSLHFAVGLPPHVALARVVSGTGGGARLEVEGFPAATEQTDPQGQRARITEKEARREDPPLNVLKVAVLDIPEPGFPRRVVQALVWGLGGLLVLAAGYLLLRTLGLLGGARGAADGTGGLGTSLTPKERKARVQTDRAALLEDLEDLERARARGDLGPKTYAKAREELMLALARTFA